MEAGFETCVHKFEKKKISHEIKKNNNNDK